MNPTATTSIQVLPQGLEQKQSYEVIEKVIDYIKSTGLNYIVCPLGTTIEGDLDSIISVIKHAQELCIDNGAKSVISVIEIIYNREGVVSIDEKISKFR